MFETIGFQETDSSRLTCDTVVDIVGVVVVVLLVVVVVLVVGRL